ncbi:MAG: hypothetical protein AAB036_05580 [Elusimicrobiota bacterium]
MMKRTPLVLAAAALLAASAALAATVTVLVQETTLRKRPQFFAPSAGTARLGQTFESEDAVEGWYKVSRGYLHHSAVTTKSVHLGSEEGVGGGASVDEITLAGKGFNAQVEKSYGAKNSGANFSAVDALERRSVGESALLSFLRAGGLLPTGAAQ